MAGHHADVLHRSRSGNRVGDHAGSGDSPLCGAAGIDGRDLHDGEILAVAGAQAKAPANAQIRVDDHGSAHRQGVAGATVLVRRRGRIGNLIDLRALRFPVLAFRDFIAFEAHEIQHLHAIRRRQAHFRRVRQKIHEPGQGQGHHAGGGKAEEGAQPGCHGFSSPPERCRRHRRVVTRPSRGPGCHCATPGPPGSLRSPWGSRRGGAR